jgi:predicted N-acetyltransferase YhbS
MIEVRSMRAGEDATAGALAHDAFRSAAAAHGHAPPWTSEADAAALLSRYREAEPEGVVVAEVGGAVVGVGAMRMRGEVATVGPVAVAADGRGIGTAIVETLVERAEGAGAAAIRVYADAWNPASYALFTGHGFGVVDLVAHVERSPAAPPRLESSRGLEVRPVTPADLDLVEALDRQLTGQERRGDLERRVRCVACRRGAIVGYLGAAPAGDAVLLGPAVAADVTDLFTLVATVLAGRVDGAIDAALPVRARLSTAAPAATLAARALGFRVRELGVVLSRGAPPPTRPPQLYSIDPDVL